MDQYEESPPEGWPRWMDRKIVEAQFVLMICTERYYQRVMGLETAGEGLGVKWEGTLIYHHIYNAGTQNTKFLPVLLRPENVAHIPTPLQGATRYSVATPQGYDDLHARLTGRPKVEKPPLGKRRPLEEKKAKTDFSMYLSIPIDVELWNRAGWRATFFRWGGGKPPMLGLAFQDQQAAQKIFEGWHERYGDSDTYEELRVSIVEGDIRGEDAGYSVHIGPDPKNTIKRYRDAGLKFDLGNDALIMVSRINRMNPAPESKNLHTFKSEYRKYETYSLVPGLVDKDGSNLRLSHKAGIHKSSIYFRHVNEIISKNDLDWAVLGTGKMERPRHD